MEGFWKLFSTLFGIGAAISIAKSIRSKKSWQEVVSELIISGFLSVGAAITYIIFPTVPFISVVAVGSILAILGVAFLGDKIEVALDKATDKFLTKKDS